MPPLMTCIVGKHLCQDVAVEDHWNLRREAVALVVSLCFKFNDRYPDLQV
jgi:transcription initiation factor TFIID subunit 6